MTTATLSKAIYIDTTELQNKIERLSRTVVTVELSSLKEVRLMFGTISMTPICDEIWSITDIKKEYLRRVKYRIIELKNQLTELKNLENETI